MKQRHDLTEPARTKAIKALERGNLAGAERIARRDLRRQARRIAARRATAGIPAPRLTRAAALRRYWSVLRAPGPGQHTRPRALALAVRQALRMAFA
jgi:hypothetical protein